MATDVKVYNGTPITWKAASGDYALTLASLTTTSTGAWQGAKGDLTTPRGARFVVRLQTKMTAATTGTVEVWWAASPTSTASSDNPGGASGADAVYVGLGTTAQSKQQLQFVGVMVLETTTAAQYQDIGMLDPIYRYGSPVIVNLASVAFTATTTDHILTLTPIIDQLQ
jgi:hypothetical protein